MMKVFMKMWWEITRVLQLRKINKYDLKLGRKVHEISNIMQLALEVWHTPYLFYTSNVKALIHKK